MAKSDYSADSSVSPLPLLPPGLFGTGAMSSFKIAIPASIIEHSPAITTSLIETNPCVEDRCIGCRLHDHDEVRARHSTPISRTPID